MPRVTMQTLRDELVEAERRALRAELAVLVAIDEAAGIAPAAVERFEDGPWAWELSLWRASGASGGIVRAIGRCQLNRLPDVWFRQLDRALEIGRGGITSSSLVWRTAMDRLRVARNKAGGQ